MERLSDLHHTQGIFVFLSFCLLYFTHFATKTEVSLGAWEIRCAYHPKITGVHKRIRRSRLRELTHCYADVSERSSRYRRINVKKPNTTCFKYDRKPPVLCLSEEFSVFVCLVYVLPFAGEIQLLTNNDYLDAFCVGGRAASLFYLVHWQSQQIVFPCRKAKLCHVVCVFKNCIFPVPGPPCWVKWRHLFSNRIGPGDMLSLGLRLA